MAQTKLDMTEGAILPKLMKFAVPLMASAILQLLFNAADMVVVSWYAGGDSLAAVGSTSSLINLLVNFVLGLSIGANVVAANFLGARRSEDVSKTVHTAMVLSVIAGLVLTAAGLCFSGNILSLMYPEENKSEHILNLSILYLKYFFGGIIVSVIYNFGASLLRAKGDTRRPLIILLCAGFLNILLNLLFVIGLRGHLEGVAGVGLATVLSQAFAAVWVLIIMFRENDEFRLSVSKLKLHGSIVIKIIKIGLPAGIQSALFSFSNVIIQSTVNAFGASFIAGNSACQTLEGFIYVSMNCIAQSCMTFISQNYGAHQFERIKKVFHTAAVCVIVIGGVLGSLALYFDDRLFSIMNLTPDELNAAKSRFSVIAGTYLTCGLMDVGANSIRGMGISFFPMVVTLIGACGLRIVYLFTFFRFESVYSYQNIFWSYPVSWVITIVFLYAGFYYFHSKLKSLSSI